MTLEEAIKHCEEVAKENDDSAKEFYRVSKLETHPDRKYAEDVYVECKKCAAEHRQLAEWLKELKKRRAKDDELGRDVFDTISRQAAIDIITAYPHGDVWNVENMESMVYEIKNLPPAQPDVEYISRQAVTESDLIDWYINSVDDSEPVWTEEHVYELFNDFYLIPKED